MQASDFANDQIYVNRSADLCHDNVEGEFLLLFVTLLPVYNFTRSIEITC